MAKKAHRLRQIQAGVLSLLRPHTFGASPPPDPNFGSDAQAWLDAHAYAQRIHAALPFLVQTDRAPWAKNVPLVARAALSDSLHRERMLLALLDWELEKAMEVVSRAKVPTIVLKGMDVGRRLYPDPVFRPMTDVDLLVRPRDFSKVVSRFESAGFAAVGPQYPGRFRVELSRGENRPVVELHSFLLKGDNAETMKGIWKRAEESDRPELHRASVLSDPDQLFYLGAHAAVQHLIESPIWLNDLHFLLKRIEVAGDFDWPKLLKQIESRRCYTAFWFLFSILKDWGRTAPADVIAELHDQVAPGRRAALSVLAPVERLFPYAGRGWTWMLSGRFLMKDNTLGAVRYAIEREGIAKVYRRLARG